MEAGIAPVAGIKRKSRFAETPDEPDVVQAAQPAVVPPPAQAPQPLLPAVPGGEWSQQQTAEEATAEDEAVRRRREKLAAWKAKQASAPSGASASLPVTQPAPANAPLQQIKSLLQQNAALDSSSRQAVSSLPAAAPSVPAARAAGAPAVPVGAAVARPGSGTSATSSVTATTAPPAAAPAAKPVVSSLLPLKLGGPKLGMGLQIGKPSGTGGGLKLTIGRPGGATAPVAPVAASQGQAATAAPVVAPKAAASVFADDEDVDGSSGAGAGSGAVPLRGARSRVQLPLLEEDEPAQLVQLPAGAGSSAGQGAGAGASSSVGQASHGAAMDVDGGHGHGQAARAGTAGYDDDGQDEQEEDEDQYLEAWRQAMKRQKEAEEAAAAGAAGPVVQPAAVGAGASGAPQASSAGAGVRPSVAAPSAQPHASATVEDMDEDVTMAVRDGASVDDDGSGGGGAGGGSTREGGAIGDGAESVARRSTGMTGAGGVGGLAAQLLRRGMKRPRPSGSAAGAGAGSSAAADNVDLEDEDDKLYQGEEWSGPGRSALDQLRDKLSAKTIKPVDHSKMEYSAFAKSFYVEHPEVTGMAASDVAELRADAEIAVRGKAVPRPIVTWEHSGLPNQLLSLMPGRGFTAPFAIQKQALPVIMSGRDVIGVARTGSGKTLAYVLPMLRHVMAQEPLAEGEGPIALVLAPARELVVQIYHETRRFAKHLDVRTVAVYGGAPVAEQIGEMKRGSEILIATPGRLIDLLTLNAGRLLSFKRVTYIVLDEADRMFDLGFEPQVTKILSLIRPDRQTVMFSATFPPHVEALARKALRTPVEIVVGGRSKASSDVAQWVEVRPENTKFARTLQLLGEWYERGAILIFVDTQERCDELFAALYKAGYPALSLHGGKDQADRDQALADFKAGLRTVLVATSVAGRGLDVKNLCLVINFSCPNHLEDYVHRVGRTGRAGTKGTAFTFITPAEGAYAADLVRALKDAKQEEHVPAELRALSEAHAKAVAEGTARKRASGYSSAKGFKFDATELDAAAKARRVARQAAEIEAGIASVDDILAEQDRDAQERDEEDRLAAEKAADAALVEPGSLVAVPGVAPSEAGSAASSAAVPAATTGAGAGASSSAAGQAAPPAAAMPADGAARAAAVAAMIQKQLAAAGVLSADALAAVEGSAASTAVKDELDINEYPQQARWRLMKEGLKRIEEFCGVAITSKGVYVAPGRQPPAGERKLYLLIEGKSAQAVRQARNEARRVLEEETLRLGANLDRAGMGGLGKYNIV